MRLQAMGGNLILKPTAKKAYSGSIALPDSAQTVSDFCEVVSVGEYAVSYKVGDVVLRPNPAEVEWTDEEDDDQLYLIVPEASIVAKVRPDGD